MTRYVWGLNAVCQRKIVDLLIRDDLDEDERERRVLMFWGRMMENEMVWERSDV